MSKTFYWGNEVQIKRFLYHYQINRRRKSQQTFRFLFAIQQKVHHWLIVKRATAVFCFKLAISIAERSNTNQKNPTRSYQGSITILWALQISMCVWNVPQRYCESLTSFRSHSNTQSCFWALYMFSKHLSTIIVYLRSISIYSKLMYYTQIVRKTRD